MAEVLIIDDSKPMGMETARRLEESGHTVVGLLHKVPTRREVRRAKRNGMQVAVLDEKMSDRKGGKTDGEAAAKVIRRRAPGTTIVAFTYFQNGTPQGPDFGGKFGKAVVEKNGSRASFEKLAEAVSAMGR